MPPPSTGKRPRKTAGPRRAGSRLSAAGRLEKQTLARIKAERQALDQHLCEITRFEHELEEKNLELAKASRMKSEFLANMSHELRTPLNAIIGFSEVLRDGLIGEMSDRQRGFIGDIFTSGQHLLSLINDILDLSKVEAGRMTLDLESVAMESVLANGLSMVREKGASRRVQVHIESGDPGSIQADARKVKQIVYNLLSNAVKFSHEGGQVSLRAIRVPRSEVGRLSSPQPGRSLQLADSSFEEFLQISVTDAGIGIPADALEQLFAPFTQIDSGLARKFEGSGLGLAIVRLLAELHGGAVAVQSALGEGSRFTVWLPIRQRADQSAQLDRPLPSPGAALGLGRTALVVEDDLKSAELIRMQLEAEGFKVLVAPSAEAALRLALKEPLSLITLDIMLPNIDGWEFLSRLKQHPQLQRVPVVLISMVAEPNKGFALGAAAVLQKPIARLELQRVLIDISLLPLAHQHALTVLAVDDDPRAVELIAARCASLATRVLRAHGGREAIEIARRELPDLIVLDLMMPEVSGFDVVTALLERPETARIPVVVVTAKDITADDRTRLEGCVARIMNKTDFDAARFTAEVRRALFGRDTAV